MTGPYSTEEQARADAHALVAPEPGWSTLLGPGRREVLARALQGAGVELGDYDQRIMSWLSGWEDSVCAVIAGWITRAGERPRALGLTPRDRRTILAALTEAAETRETAAGTYCDDCASAPAGACDQHAADLDAADDYRQAARRIGGES